MSYFDDEIPEDNYNKNNLNSFNETKPNDINNINDIINNQYEEDRLLEKVADIIESIESEIDKFGYFTNYLFDDVIKKYLEHNESYILNKLNNDVNLRNDKFFEYMIKYSKAYKILLNRLEEYKSLEKILINNRKIKIQKLIQKYCKENKIKDNSKI